MSAADQIIAGALIAVGLAVGLLVLLAGLMRSRGRDAVAPPARKVYRCTAGHGPTKCTAPATRIVLRVTGPTEGTVMCDDDAFRAARLGHVIDLGPIYRATR